jgi:hypothetical protein
VITLLRFPPLLHAGDAAEGPATAWDGPHISDQNCVLCDYRLGHPVVHTPGGIETIAHILTTLLGLQNGAYGRDTLRGELSCR